MTGLMVLAICAVPLVLVVHLVWTWSTDRAARRDDAEGRRRVVREIEAIEQKRPHHIVEESHWFDRR